MTKTATLTFTAREMEAIAEALSARAQTFARIAEKCDTNGWYALRADTLNHLADVFVRANPEG